MHGGWYASGMGALGASGGLQGGFSSGGLGGAVVPHSQSYHLMVCIQVSISLNFCKIIEKPNSFGVRMSTTNSYVTYFSCHREQHGDAIMRDGIAQMQSLTNKR